jgi:hypothetical protein
MSQRANLNRETRSIIEIGVVYGVVMILIDFLLNRFSLLLWATLSILSVIFALVMLDILSNLTSSDKLVHLKNVEIVPDEVVRLQKAIERAVAMHETQSVLVEKIRSVGLSLVSARLKLTRDEFGVVFDQNPEAAIQLIKDQEIVALLSGETLNLTNLQQIEALLAKIESL